MSEQPKAAKRPRLADHAPWKPPQWQLADAGALQALERGDADLDAQRRALKFIVETVCGTYEPSYRADSQRDTDFAEGKRYVGLQIVKYLKTNLSKLRSNEDG